ncbi:Uncharacterised protein [Burkholderia oklahomensis]|nr:hypothetical protein BG90_1905 [Burkholderia oklahomensis C6786]SUW58259.1 Uncharacterised protein [Burkholderia oklahomensis]
MSAIRDNGHPLDCPFTARRRKPKWPTCWKVCLSSCGLHHAFFGQIHHRRSLVRRDPADALREIGAHAGRKATSVAHESAETTTAARKTADASTTAPETAGAAAAAAKHARSLGLPSVIFRCALWNATCRADAPPAPLVAPANTEEPTDAAALAVMAAAAMTEPTPTPPIEPTPPTPTMPEMLGGILFVRYISTKAAMSMTAFHVPEVVLTMVAMHLF